MHITAEAVSAWPVIGREEQQREALETLGIESNYQGVALVGESGVGKSTLARALGAQLSAQGRTVRFVLGTQTGRDVPLGAFSRSVTVDASREPVAMLAAAHQNLTATTDPVIIVDDAQLLDPLSATLTYQLAAERDAHLIVVIRSGEPVSDAVGALLKERLLLNLHVGPFTREQTGELARRVLGGVVSPQVIDGLHGRSAGLPLYLRGLLRAGTENGVLVESDEGWHLQGSLHADQELSDLLEFRLQGLTAEELEALEILATAEVLDWEVFRELCSPEAVCGLERHRLIHLASDGSGTLAQVTHPVFGDAALARAGVVRLRRLNGLLAKAYQKHLRRGGPRIRLPDMRGQIRLAQFMIRSDLKPDLELIIRAATSATAVANLSQAEDLSRFALEHGGGLPAALVLADALCWQGRGDAAERVLKDVSLDGAADRSIVQWACLRASNLFWNCGDIEAARTVLSQLQSCRYPESSTAMVESVELSVAFFSGDMPATALGDVSMFGAEELPVATALAALPTAYALAAAGRFEEVTAVADAGLRAVVGGRLGTIRYGFGVAEVLAAVVVGDFAAAESVAERYAAMAAGVPEPDAMAGVLFGLVYLARGQLSAASAAFQNAIPALVVGAQAMWPMLASAWATQAESARGNASAASVALRRCESACGPQAAAFLPEVELARAWERAAHGETSAGRAHALRAAQVARNLGMHAVEMRALHTAVRFGDRAQADRLSELARILKAPLPELAAAQARGMANHDADLLSSTSDRFAALGAFATAADAAAQASCEYARGGQRGKQLESSTRSQWLAKQGDIHTPAVTEAVLPLPITGREREIAMLVAAGLSNREIAQRLSVSVRTIDGHLYRMFAKLGIERRDQVVRLFGGLRTEA